MKLAPRLRPGIQRFEAILIFCGVLLLFVQFSQVIQLITRESSDWGILFLKDNDSSNAVSILADTDWNKDNGWYAYGPLYYRISRTLLRLDPLAQNGSPEQHQELERARHFSMMLLSVLALYGLALLLAFSVGHTPVEWLFGTIAIAFSLMSGKTWAHFLYVAHPDLLLGCLAAWGTILAILLQAKWDTTGRPWQIPSFWGCAAVWGLACATKLSTALFLPGLIFLFLPPIDRKRFFALCLFYGCVITTYFTVGLPQSLKISKIREFSKIYSSYVTRATWSSVAHVLNELAGQIALPALVLTLMVILVFDPQLSVDRRGNSGGRTKWLFAIPLLPLVFQLSYAYVASIDHYLLPIVGSLLALYSSILPGILRKFIDWSSPVSYSRYRSFLITIGVLAVLLWAGVGVPDSMISVYKSRNRCRTDGEEIEALISSFVREGRTVISDPYVPINTRDSKRVKFEWGHLPKDLSEPNLIFATNEDYYSRFFPETPSPMERVDHPITYPELRQFYLKIKKGDPIYDSTSRRWRRLRKTSCGLEIWSPTEPSKEAAVRGHKLN